MKRGFSLVYDQVLRYFMCRTQIEYQELKSKDMQLDPITEDLAFMTIQ